MGGVIILKIPQIEIEDERKDGMRMDMKGFIMVLMSEKFAFLCVLFY